MRDLMLESLEMYPETVKKNVRPIVGKAHMWAKAQGVGGFGKYEDAVRIAMRDSFIVGYLEGMKEAHIASGDQDG